MNNYSKFRPMYNQLKEMNAEIAFNRCRALAIVYEVKYHLYSGKPYRDDKYVYLPLYEIGMRKPYVEEQVRIQS